MKPFLKKLTVPAVIVATIVLLCGFYLANFYRYVFYRFDDAKKAGVHLVTDPEWGFYAIQPAIDHGDAALASMWEASNHGERINGRNAPWIADVLSSHSTPLAVEIATKLHAHHSKISRLVGEVALAKFGKLDDKTELVEAFTKPSDNDPNEDMFRLAVMGIGSTQETRAVRGLSHLIGHAKADEWTSYHACLSLAELDPERAAPILKEAILFPPFCAPNGAYIALKKLGDKGADALAIQRLGYENEPDWLTGSLILALEQSTGQHFGRDVQAWRRWLNSTREPR